jgi:uncharacterized protein YndB with AHSA1/START domain
VLGELERVGDLWELRFERRLRHSPERVWKALTDPEELKKWFPDTIVVSEWRVGARLQFRHEGGLYAFDGEVLAYDPPRVLEIRWGTDRVRFEVEPAKDGSVLTLIDTIDQVGKAARDAAGWHVCLDRLEAALDGKPAPPDDAWNDLNRDYVKKLGPEAATIGPPEGAV